MPMSALLLALAAAAAPQYANAVAPRHSGPPFISPMGEPFRAGPSGDALADWFHQADRNHDSLLTVDEMRADADRFFDKLDVNHDGEIDPDEVARYEGDVAPEVQGEPATIYDTRGAAGAGSSDQAAVDPDPDSGGVDIPGGGVDGPQGAGSFGLINLPEPVTAADTDLDRSITREEFRRAASDRFALLDTSHSGRLTLQQLEAMRPSGRSRGSHHHRGTER